MKGILLRCSGKPPSCEHPDRARDHQAGHLVRQYWRHARWFDERISWLASKDLGRNLIAILNLILSARLICVLDSIFAETTLIEPSAWAEIAGPQTDSGNDFPSRSRIFAVPRTFIATRQEKSKIAGVR
jgi:hypothetical protein